MYDNQVHVMKKRCMRKHYRDLGDFLEGSGKEPIGTEPQLFMRTKKMFVRCLCKVSNDMRARLVVGFRRYIVPIKSPTIKVSRPSYKTDNFYQKITTVL